MILSLAIILAFVSFLDDMNDISIFLRLGIHLGAASIFAIKELSPLLGEHQALNSLSWPMIILVILAIAWMINLYNFMDGIDGLSGGMTAIGFSAYALASLFSSHDQRFVLANVCIVAATLIFLCFNFAPAKIFMGDAGSTTLGFLAASFGAYGWQHGYWAWWFPIVVFLPFIIDASFTLLKRLFRGEKIWLAHRDHYYQRLTRSGWGHRKTTLAAYALMGICAFSAISLNKQAAMTQFVGLAMLFIAFAIVLRFIDHKWQLFKA
ncbi:MAG: hypothetical protein R2865_15505 [Deinococcales bacterium]